MKHLGIIIIAVCIIAALCGGFYYYHYNYVEEVTERYLVKHSSKVEISRLRFYENDSVAVEAETKALMKYKDDLLKLFEKESFGDNEKIIEAKAEAYKEMYAETRAILVFTHVRNTSPKEILDIIRKYGLVSEQVKNYVEKHKIRMKVYPL